MPRLRRLIVFAGLLPLAAGCVRVYDQTATSITTCTNENFGGPRHTFQVAEAHCQKSGLHAVKIGSGLCVYGYQDQWTCKPAGPQTRIVNPELLGPVGVN